MKMKQLKKALCITLASAMLVANVPVGSFASETTLSGQSSDAGSGEAGNGSTDDTGSGNGETGSTENGNGGTESTENTGSGETGNGNTGETGNTGSGETGNGSTDDTGSGNGETESTESGNGGTESAENTGSGETGNGNTGETGNTGSGETGSTENTGNGETGSTENIGSGNTGSTENTGNGETVNTGNGETGNTESTENTETGNESESNNVPRKLARSTAQTISLEWSCASDTVFEYNGKNQAPTVTTEDVTLTYTVEKDGQEVNEAVEPGSYTITAASAGGETLENAEISFTIEKATISSFSWTGTETAYTGSAITALPEATFASAVEGEDALEATVSLSLQQGDTELVNDAIVNAGTYTVEVELTNDQKDYYKIADSVETTQTFKVGKCPVTISWDYDDAATFTYDGNEQNPKVTGAKDSNGVEYTTELKIEGVDEEDNKQDAAPVNVGSYIATAVIENLDSTNYEIKDGTRTFSIVQRGITINWEDAEVIYDGTERTLSWSISTDDEAFKDSISVAYTYEDADGNTVSVKDADGKDVGPVNAGTYTATATISDGNCAVETTSATKTLTIKKCPVMISWDSVDGTSFTYDGNEQNPKVTGAKDSNGVEYTTELKIEGVDEEDNKSDATPVNVGSYIATAEIEDFDSSNYEIKDGTRTFSIVQRGITINWEDAEVIYDGTERTLSWSISTDDEAFKDSISVAYTYEDADGNTVSVKDADGKDVGPVNAGTYTATATISDNNCAVAAASATRTLTIKQLPITVTADAKEKYYGADDPELTYNIDIDTTVVLENKEDVLKDARTALDKAAEKTESGKTLVRETGEDAGDYKITCTVGELENYKITCESVYFKIKKLPIVVTAVTGGVNSKYYGADDPTEYDYTVEIETDTDGNRIDASASKKDPATIKSELAKAGTTMFTRPDKGLKDDGGENAGKHDLTLVITETANYTITGNGEKAFIIDPLPVTVTPDAGQEKIFGQAEPSLYTYTVTIGDVETNLKKADVKSELGSYVLQRAEGEGVGEYKYSLIPDTSALYGKTNYANFDLTVADAAFKINAIEITDVQSINSRQDSFKVTTNLTGERQSGVTTKIKVEAVEFPVSADGITFSQDMNTYVTGATDGIAFTGASDTIKINTAAYQKKRKDNGKLLEWNGYLPAGTTVKVSIVDGNGNTVSAKAKTVVVSPVSVTLNWGAYETSASTGNYVIANNGKVNPLSLSSDRTGEWAEILYSKNGSGKAEASYDVLDMSFTPGVNNSGSAHVTQSVSANVVDTLNLTCEAVALQFYVDDSAFPIPASSVQFENRGEEIRIQLPEMGTVTSVTIPGGTVTVSGELSQEFTFPVSWSGENLIATGSAISIEYTDQAGHQGTGSAAASRSTVSTPITFKIRPELNGNGYLNGQSSTLIVSGTACSCEPIQVTVANMTQSTFATQKEVWSDSNGSWEALFDMSALPEGEDFTISAEYMDVNGPGYSITARFDAFCASPATLSPIYEAMTHISGMVEAGTAVALVVNGDTQNYFEIEVDRFGHFSMDDVPMMFADEDSFDIYVTDIAGNIKIRHYEIEEPGDPFEVDSLVNPLGKIFYSAEEENSVAYVATPVSADDFEEDQDSIELPLLLGMSYEVGTLTIQRTENGFTVTSELQMDDAIDPEDYSVNSDKLYVYTSRPDIELLRNYKGEEYQYGEEIPLGEDGTVWIVSEKDMTILAEDIMELELFDYEDSEEYVDYQEQ